MRRIGIDLGTTNTLMYMAYFPVGGGIEDFTLASVKVYYEHTGSVVNPPVENSMPSVLYGKKVAGSDNRYEYTIGKVAEIEARNDGSPMVLNAKRLLCLEEPSAEIAYGLTAQGIAQKLLEGCYFSIKKEVSAYGLKNTQYCITQPAAFGMFASRSIQDAAIPAGFKNAEPLKEPIAALLNYLYEQLSNPDKAEELLRKQREHNNRLLTMVVDIGGGTTDVTIQEISISGELKPPENAPTCTGYQVNFLNQSFDEEPGQHNAVASANQEPAFGGLDFDSVIVQHIVDELNRQYFDATGHDYNWESLEGSREHADRYARSQNYKMSLSSGNKQNLDDSAKLDINQTLSCSFDAETVMEWTKPLCALPVGAPESDRTVYGIILDTIKRSGYRVEDIDCLYVTGGMSSYQPIREMLNERFSKLKDSGKLIFSSTPLEDIAKGAALCDCFFKVNMPRAVLYADLMIDDPCGKPIILAERNRPLPISNRTIPRFMKLRNPAYLYIDVLWGFGEDDYRMKRLRRLRQPLTRVTATGTDISVKYSIDVHQAMDIELIVHDINGEYTVPLLQLIRDIDLIHGGNDNG